MRTVRVMRYSCPLGAAGPTLRLRLRKGEDSADIERHANTLIGSRAIDGGRAPLPERTGRHCQSKFYTACSRTRAARSSTVFAHESPMRSPGFDAENRLYLFALTVPKRMFSANAI